jgi:uncharacterized repeat protein (TIGR03803 family)
MTRPDAVRKLNWAKRIVCYISLCVATRTALPAQTFTTLFSFDGTDGAFLAAGLVQATNGDLYGTTGAASGDSSNGGTVFKITPSGTLTTLYYFCSQTNCTDGRGPLAGLVQATNGDFYGTTAAGGTSNGGTVFKITPSGTLTTLYSFCSQSGGADGCAPTAGLVQATNGDFYGTTKYGGANGYGTVFKITPSGTFTTLYSFCSQSNCADGTTPTAALLQATDGDFYGTTLNGGIGSYGTVFKITPTGSLTTLYRFCSQSGCRDGYVPQAALVQATNGEIYGTTTGGGTKGSGTVFKITPDGMLTTLHSFDGTDGSDPYGGLVQATDGDFYGTTLYASTGGYGTIFKITPSGTLTTLYVFCTQPGCTDGKAPVAALVQDTNGKFYGTTYGGGANSGSNASYGTVFSLSVDLGSFVETRPTSGKVGAVVEILGTDLTGATSVSFNGIEAVFKVVAISLITATVPAGATTGTVQVVTPAGTLSSNVPFRVLP